MLMLGLKLSQLLDLVNIPRILAGVATIVLLAIGLLAPPKTLPLFPTSHSTVSAALTSNTSLAFSSHWKIDDNGHPTLMCALVEGDDSQACSAEIVFHRDSQSDQIKQAQSDNSILKSIDLTRFSGLKVSINYKGGAPYVMAYYRNLSEGQVERPNLKLGKLHYSTIHPEEYDRPVHIPFSEFKVGDKWLRQHTVHRKKSTPERTHIAEIAFGLPENTRHGVHVLRIESVTASGVWLSRENMYLGIIATWALYALIELIRWVMSTRSRTLMIEHSLSRAHHDANTDALTSLLNRRAINAIVADDKTTLPSWAIIIFDIDHFKRINDEHGHKAGDLMLVQLSKLLSDHTGSDDYLGRWGGEEFILLNKHIDKVQTQKLAEKLRSTIASTPFFVDKKKESAIQLTISCGLTICQPYEDFEQALERADKALYIAKHNGRNRVIDL